MMKINKKNIWRIVFFIVITTFIGTTIFSKEMGDLDEVWNYNFGNCISKGLVPYRDFSMVQTPLLAFINGTILSIFPNNIITFRIIAVLLCSLIFGVMYKIFRKLNINEGIGALTIFSLLFIYREHLCLDYNYFSVFLTLLIIFFELKLNMEKKFNNVLIGILGGLTFLTKQSIGGFVCVSIVLYKLIFEIYKKKRYEEKINIKPILYRILGGIIPVIIFIIYLILNNALYSFIDYAILGIQTFSNKIGYDSLINSSDIITKIFSLYIPISFIIMLIYSIKNKDKNIFIILALSISSFSLVFPISDSIHFFISIIPSIIGNVYLINKLLKRIYSEKFLPIKIFIMFFSKIIMIYVLIFGISIMNKNTSQEKYYGNLKHFEGIPISESYENEIKMIDEYIKNNEKKVYILNFDAAMYMIPIDKYNKNYDMLMKGNFGIRGEEGLIEDIKNESNAIYLVLNKEFEKNWQHPNKVTDYVEKNLRNIGNVGNFEIYIK